MKFSLFEHVPYVPGDDGLVPLEQLRHLPQGEPGCLALEAHLDPGATVHLEESPTAPDPAWDVITLQPDPLLPAEGLFDALALVDSPPVAMPFAVTFVWNSASPPGPQPFVVYDPGFHTVESGMTFVPEPGTGLLVAAGLGLLAGWHRRPRRCGSADGAGSP